MPYRSHVQQDEVDETELGEVLLLARESVSEGTSEPESDSESLLSSSESLRDEAASLALKTSTVGFLKFSCAICRVAFGLPGVGEWILSVESGRPLGMLSEVRRECEPEVELRFSASLLGSGAFAGGMSKTFSLRPVVGSATDSRAGS